MRPEGDKRVCGESCITPGMTRTPRGGTRTLLRGLVGLLALLLPPAALAQDLTLRDVIELHRTGLGEDLVMAVIEADGGPFTLTLADIQDLKSDGLSERVIATLVRTGARHQEAIDGDRGAALVVPVQQVTTYYAPTLVIIAVPPGELAPPQVGQDGRAPGTFDSRGGPRVAPPPATWVTRRTDGANVTSSGEIRRGVPPAAWVTPRDPKPRERPADGPSPR